MVSALNASLVLLEHGFIQELNILFRTIDESLEDICFLLSPQADGKASEAQTKFLDDFYQEEFSDPKNPFISEQKRKRVRRSKIHAEIGRLMSDFVNPSDGANTYSTMSNTLSGYVHGAYPHIMELYEGNQAHFHLNGMLGTLMHESSVRQARYYYYSAIQALMLLSQAFQKETLTTKLLELRNSFEKETNLESTGDAAKKIRDIKNGRS